MAVEKPQLNFSERVIAGACAGMIEVLIMYPTDVIKTRAQLSTGRSENVFRALSSAVRSEGFGVYRGILPLCISEPPKRALKFTSNSTASELLVGAGFTTGGEDGTPVRVNQLGASIAGVTSGVLEAILICPAELAKVRLQDPAQKALYNGTLDLVSKVVGTEGVTAIFRGLEATIWRHGLWNGAYFSVIHSFRSLMPEVGGDGPLGAYGPRLRDFTAGTAAGIVATAVNIPTDVAKSRIQSARGAYGWTLPTVASIGRAEGIAALYKGFAPKVLRLGPGGGIMLVAYEAISGWLLKLRTG